MNDYQEKGYFVGKTFEKPFTEKEMASVMTTLAQFHATSMKFLRENSNIKEKLQSSHLMFRLPSTIEVMKTMIQGVFEISGRSENVDKFMEKLLNLQENLEFGESIIQDDIGMVNYSIGMVNYSSIRNPNVF